MPRGWPEVHVTNGKAVGFKLRQSRGGNDYFVFFNDTSGRRREINTNCTGIDKARVAVRNIIDREYATPVPSPMKVIWDEARTRLKARMAAAGIKPGSVKYYLKVFGYVHKMFSATDGPADITPGMAQAWADQYATGKGRGDKVRSGHTAASTITAVCVIWQKWFCEQLKIIPSSPFADVLPPKTDKPTITIPTDDKIADFYGWLTDRFAEWPMPRLFFELKGVTGCRVLDLCSLRSDQLRDGRIHFDADQTKGRKARAVPLPADLHADLDAIKGKQHLWDSYPNALKAALKKKGWPTHQLRSDFDTQRMLAWVMTVFADYNADRPGEPKLTSHQFRKLAFTRAWEAGIDPRKASIALACNIETMMNHYVRLNEQDVTDEVFGKLTPTQRPTHRPA